MISGWRFPWPTRRGLPSSLPVRCPVGHSLFAAPRLASSAAHSLGLFLYPCNLPDTNSTLPRPTDQPTRSSAFVFLRWNYFLLAILSLAADEGGRVLFFSLKEFFNWRKLP